MIIGLALIVFGLLFSIVMALLKFVLHVSGAVLWAVAKVFLLCFPIVVIIALIAMFV